MFIVIREHYRRCFWFLSVSWIYLCVWIFKWELYKVHFIDSYSFMGLSCLLQYSGNVNVRSSAQWGVYVYMSMVRPTAGEFPNQVTADHSSQSITSSAEIRSRPLQKLCGSTQFTWMTQLTKKNCDCCRKPRSLQVWFQKSVGHMTCLCGAQPTIVITRASSYYFSSSFLFSAAPLVAHKQKIYQNVPLVPTRYAFIRFSRILNFCYVNCEKLR